MYQCAINGSIPILTPLSLLAPLVLSSFDQVGWEEESDAVWRTTEAGVEEEDKEVSFKSSSWLNASTISIMIMAWPFPLMAPSGVFQLRPPWPLS